MLDKMNSVEQSGIYQDNVDICFLYFFFSFIDEDVKVVDKKNTLISHKHVISCQKDHQ